MSNNIKIFENMRNSSLKEECTQMIKSAAWCALLIGWPQWALANGTSVTTIIDGPPTKTTTQGPNTPVLDGGDTLIITSTGSITVLTGPAIYAVGDYNIIQNFGALSSSGQNEYGIFAASNLSTITNSGSLSTDGENGYGIYAVGDLNKITNTRLIHTIGNSASGIYTIGNSNTITNSGSVQASGNNAAGIYADSNSNIIINSGSIYTTGNSGYGIVATGDYNIIINSGSASTIGIYAYGLNIEGSFNTIKNFGLISTNAVGAYGISVLGSSSAITNNGLISTTGPGGTGILADGNNNAISNYGSIATAGARVGVSAIFADGIALFGDNNTILNYGSINTAGPEAYSIYTLGDLNYINNSGSISTNGLSSDGIGADGSKNTITNAGMIITTGNYSNGISLSEDSNGNTINNSGSIFVSGAEAIGVVTTGDSNSVTNSGSIVSAKSYAIYFDGSNNIFNSLNNFIAGPIYMGSDGTVNMTSGSNYSKLYTFEGDSLIINGSGPVPLFINSSTQQIATYDPTVFAGSSDALADMTGTISSLTPGRYNGSDKDYPLWARGFGIASGYAATDTTLERTYNTYGLAIGYDLKRSKNLLLGVLGGIGQSNLWTNTQTKQSSNNKSDDRFLGIYGQKRWENLSVDFAIYGGLQNFQQQRYVNDNLAYFGNSSTNASYQGWWISPEIGVTYDAGEVNGWSILPTARLRYAQQWIGGYTETGGGAANANVNGRNIAIGQSFIGIGTRKLIKTNLGKDTKLELDGQVGYIYRGVVGDDTVGVTMIGQSLSLPTESSNRNAVSASAGMTLDLSTSVALKIKGDITTGKGMQYVGGGWAGLSIKF